MTGHYCQGGEWREGDRGWELLDAQGIYLRRVCELCEAEHLTRYRPEILSGYDEADVLEAIEGEDALGPDDDGDVLEDVDADQPAGIVEAWASGNRKDAVRAFLALDDRDAEAAALEGMFSTRPDWREVVTFTRLLAAMAQEAAQ